MRYTWPVDFPVLGVNKRITNVGHGSIIQL